MAHEGFESDADWRPPNYETPEGAFVDEDLPSGIVEIACLHLASGLGNTISIRATETASGYTLSAADEYGETFKIKPSKIDSPLSNEQLLEAVKTLEWRDGGGRVYQLREDESESVGEEAAEFISATSDIYPAFESFIEADNQAWLAQKQGEWRADEDEEEDEDD